MKIGPYKIVGRLGSGGMGWVYLGRSPAGREVAVKVARPELAAEPEFRERFAREVAAARVVSRGSTDLDARLRAWDETEPLPDADLAIDTAEISAPEAARRILAALGLRSSGTCVKGE